MESPSVAPRRYRWGKFQGWTMLVSGLIGLLITPFRHDDPWGNAGWDAGVVLAICLGFGLIRKHRLGLILLYVSLPFEILISMVHLSISPSLTYVAILTWWTIPAVLYYPKRRNEFTGSAAPVVGTKRAGTPRLDTVTRALRNRHLRWAILGIMSVLAISIPFWLLIHNREVDLLGDHFKASDSTKPDFAAIARKYGGVPVNPQTPDYEAIAKKYGGVVEQSPNRDSSSNIDYEALAKKYGGHIEPPQVLPRGFKDWDTPSPIDPQTNFGEVCKQLDPDVVKGLPPGFELIPTPVQPYVPPPQDYAQGLVWCRKAADKGNAWAQTSLGFMYQNGLGVAQDYVQAQAWYEKAMAGGRSSEALDKYIEVSDAISAAKKEKAAKEQQMVWIVLGSCALLAGVVLGIRFRNKLVPRPRRSRQTAVLLLVASWCSACCVYPALTPALMRHPIDAAVRALLLSMPALLLGAVALWAVSNPVAPPENRSDTGAS